MAISESLVPTVGFVSKSHIIRSSREFSKPVLRSRHAKSVFCVSKRVTFATEARPENVIAVALLFRLRRRGAW